MIANASACLGVVVGSLADTSSLLVWLDDRRLVEARPPVALAQPVRIGSWVTITNSDDGEVRIDCELVLVTHDSE